MKMILEWGTNSIDIGSYEDIEDIKEAIKTKEKWIYLYDKEYYINLDLVERIQCVDKD